MTKRVLDIGNCAADHGALGRLIEDAFDAEVVASHTRQEALAALREQSFDLVLVNRRLDRDASEGLEVIRAMQSDPDLAGTPVMLLTNYPEHQQAAVEAGALPGSARRSCTSRRRSSGCGKRLNNCQTV